MKDILTALFVLLLFVSVSGCESDDDGKITVHMAYSDLVGSEVFPAPIRGKLKSILDGTNHFGMVEYQKMDLAIQKFCNGGEYTWRDEFKLLPMRALSVVIPGWDSFSVLHASELLIVRQIDAANSCKFNPLASYIGEGEVRD